jgi:putative transposase
VIDAAFTDLVEVTSIQRACQLVGRSRATHYRRRQPRPQRLRRPRVAPPNKLSPAERAAVLVTLNHESFADKSVARVWATMLDEGSYLCSESTMYRILREAGGVRERRRQATHPPRKRPELVATAPGQVWSWDIERHEAPRTEWG